VKNVTVHIRSVFLIHSTLRISSKRLVKELQGSEKISMVGSSSQADTDRQTIL